MGEKTDQISLRRLRQNGFIRELTKEIRPHYQQFIQPHFVVEGIKSREEIPGMPSIFRETPSSLLFQVEKDLERGVSKILLFGVPKQKALNFDFTSSQVSALRKRFGSSLWIAVDVCLCSNTHHGHCGIMGKTRLDEPMIENPESVVQLARAATLYAQAGANCVAPSDMMDGRIKAIRDSLEKASMPEVVLMSYSAKFHSKFYGPFRIAANSAPKTSSSNLTLKDRATYQIDPSRPEDAMASSLRDLKEGADILMVKPGLPYLDVLKNLSQNIKAPWAVYQVSGEYAAIELMAEKGLIDRQSAHMETWISFVRAGASIIISYSAREAREWLS